MKMRGVDDVLTVRRWWRALPVNIVRSWRATRRAPLFAIAVVGTVAFVMAAMSVAFVVFDATVLRALPYPDDDRVVVVYTMPPGVTDIRLRNPLHAVDLVRFRERTRTLEAIEGIVISEQTVAQGAVGEAMPVGRTSAGLFPMLGLRMALGRAFSVEEDRQQARVAILTYGLWRTSFGEAPDIIGRRILIDGEPHDVIGVLSHASTTPFATANVWRPLGVSETNLPLPFATFILGVGRLLPHASIEQAAEDVQSMMTALGNELPKTHDGWKAGVVRLREWQFGDQRYAVTLIMIAATLVLVVGWVNLLNLFVADALGRRAEQAMSMALGASAADLLGANLVRIATLMTAGAVVGLLCCSAALFILQGLDRGALGPVGELRVNFRVQLLIGALTLIGAILTAVVPMKRIRFSVLSDASYRVAGTKRGRVARVSLVALQISAVMALLACSFVLSRAVYRLHRVPTGFTSDGVLVALLRMPGALYPSIEARSRALETFMDAARLLPGVSAVGSVTNPMSPGANIATQIEVEGLTGVNRQPVPVQFRMIAGDYFAALTIPVHEGRGLDDTDSAETPLVAVVSRLLAERFWPGGPVVGRRLRRPLVDSRWITVVGVVDDVSDTRAGQPADGILYMPYAQFNPEIAPVALMIRGNGDLANLIAPLRQVILKQNPLQPIARVQPLDTFVTASFAPQHFRASALSLMTLVALVLGGLGIFGIISRAVAEQAPEIGVRKALGASNWVALIPATKETILGTGLGLLMGIPLTLSAGTLMATLLPETANLDVSIIGLALISALVVVAVSAVLPVWRAYRLSPGVTLRGL